MRLANSPPLQNERFFLLTKPGGFIRVGMQNSDGLTLQSSCLFADIVHLLLLIGSQQLQCDDALAFLVFDLPNAFLLFGPDVCDEVARYQRRTLASTVGCSDASGVTVQNPPACWGG